LVQTKTVTDFPIVLFGKSYYRSLMETMEDMVARGAASKEDLSLILLLMILMKP
jgi:predicted Rossmann-fold nucleotide-binding protein